MRAQQGGFFPSSPDGKYNAASLEQVIEYRQEDECTLGDYYDGKHLASAQVSVVEETCVSEVRTKMTLCKMREGRDKGSP